jgi:hypothetical protein
VKRHSPLLAVAVSALLALLVGDPLAAPCALCLWAIWRYTPRGEGPPVVQLAFTYQWAQVTGGLVYYWGTGRRVPEMVACDCRPMVLIGVGCLLTLLAGYRVGFWLQRRRQPVGSDGAIGWNALWAAYVIGTLGVGFLQEFAWSVPGLTQALLTLTLVRIAILFLIFRRLFHPRVRVGMLSLIVAVELTIGLTGFFADFRESLMMMLLALLERFSPRRPRDWAALGGALALMLTVAAVWTGVKMRFRAQYRNEQFASSQLVRTQRMGALSSEWLARDSDRWLADVDGTVSRIWAVYYPALAVRRVPEIVPHSDGAIVGEAIVHVLTPRLFYPDKPVLRSDSDMVRKYSGVWVAGAERETSFAFGYAAESYVDFGLPLMFVPIFLYALLMGMAHRWLTALIRDRELAVAATTALMWTALFLFERSWIKTIGASGTLLLMMSLGGYAVDRLISSRAPAPPPAAA